MTVKQEKFVMARLKDYEERLSRLERVLSASVMVNDLGVDGSPSVEGDQTHQTPSQSIEASVHGQKTAVTF